MRCIQWKWLAGALALTAIVAATSRQILAITKKEAFVAGMRSSHTMTDAEAGRVYDITQSNTRSGADADWLIAAANAQGSDRRKADPTPWFAVLLTGTDRAAMTPARREAMFQIAAALAAPPVTSGGDCGRQYTAVMLFEKLHDERALPYLRAMSESKEALVRFKSRRLVHQMTRRDPTASGR